MTRLRTVLAAAAIACALPWTAQAASGTVLHRGSTGSVLPGTLINSSSPIASYRDAEGWWVYRLGERRMFADAAIPSDRVWLTGEGLAVYIDMQGVLWLDDGASAQRLLAPDEPCPHLDGGTVDHFGVQLGGSVGQSALPFAQVACAGVTGIYSLSPSGMANPAAVPGTPVAGFDAADGTPQLGGLYDTVQWAVTSSGDVVANVQVAECAPDPLCENGAGGAFRFDGSSGEPVYISGGDAPGLPPEYRGSVLSHMRVNNEGDVAFMHESFGPPVSAVFVRQRDGLYREVARVGGAAPGTGSSFAAFNLTQATTTLPHFDIDDEGHVSFVAGTGDGALSLWQETAAGLRRVIWDGMEIPGAPGTTVDGLLEVAQSPNGRLAAIVGNATGTLPSRLVVAQDDDGELFVAWHRDLQIAGETFDGDPVFGTDSWPRVGRGLIFNDNGLLTMGIVGGSDDAAVVLDVSVQPEDEPEIALDFVLHADAPIYWGQRLDFDAVISNFGASAIASYELEVTFSPAVTEPAVDCPAHTYDAETSTLTFDCEPEFDAPPLPNGRDIAFSGQTPIRTTDGPLVLSGWLRTFHADGSFTEVEVDWDMPLLATPDGTDLQASVDDVDAATSMRVDNLGPRPTTNVVLMATLDAGAGHFTVPDDPRCTRQGDLLLLRCDVGDLGVGEGVEIPFPFLSDGSGTVHVESASPDFAPDNDSARFTLVLGVDPDEIPPGCGECRSGSPSDGGLRWAWLLVVFGLRRRREHSRRRGV